MESQGSSRIFIGVELIETPGFQVCVRYDQPGAAFFQDIAGGIEQFAAAVMLAVLEMMQREMDINLLVARNALEPGDGLKVSI